MLRPYMIARGRIHQLRGDAHLVIGFTYASLQYVLHPQFPTYLLHFYRLAFVGEGGGPGDNEQVRESGEGGGQVIGDAIAEIFLLGVVTHVDEGQHGDGGLIRQCESWGLRRRNGRRRCQRTQREMLHDYDGPDDDREPDHREDATPHIFSCDSRGRLGWCGRPRQHPEHPHRLGDILDRLLAEVLVAQRELVTEVFVDGAGDADTAGFGETFQARRHIDPVAVDLFAVDHHVAEVDPDTKLHPLVGRQVGILGPERGLDYGGALHRVHHAGELCYYAIAGGINEAPAVMLEQAVDQLAVGCKGAQRRLFMLPHEAAIAEDIGTEYSGEFTFQYPPIPTRLLFQPCLSHITIKAVPHRLLHHGIFPLLLQRSARKKAAALSRRRFS